MARYRVFDFDKLQSDFLKSFCKNDRVFFGASDEKNAYICDGHFVGVIPVQLCGVKVDNENSRMQADSFRKMLDGAEHGRAIIDTGMTKKIAGNTTVKILAFKDNQEETIWINEKYYKYFEKMDIRMSGIDDKNAVIIEIADVIVGLILPINK